MGVKIVIIDDELSARVTLRKLILNYCPEAEILGQASSVHSAISFLESNKVDIVFLDVQMQDGTGFDVLDRLGRIDFNVIFTTAYDEFAVKAFRYNAIDYLLKPINPDELILAFNKANEKATPQQVTRQINNLIKTTSEQNFDRITFPTSNGMIFTYIQNILRLESCGNYSFVFFKNGDRILTPQNLKYFEEILPSPHFFRLHQSFIVNTSFVEKTIKDEGDFVVMSDTVKVPLARRRKEEFSKLMSSSIKTKE